MQTKNCSKEMYGQFLLAAQQNFTATEMAEHLSDVAHDAITRWLKGTKLTPSTVWEQAKPLIQPNEGYLICDDTVLEQQRSTNLPLAAWQYSGNQHKVGRGIGLVTLLWSTNDEHIPTDFRIYAQGQDGDTKNQHFQHMLVLAQGRGLKPKAVLFDTWYASQTNLLLIHSFGWQWVTQLREKRVVNRTQHLRELAIPQGGLVVDLKFVGQVRVFKFMATDGDIEYWATNNINSSSEDIRLAGVLRWRIEEYHRGLKQTAGIEKCQSSTSRAQRTHIFCSIITFVSLEKLRLERSISWYQAKR